MLMLFITMPLKAEVIKDNGRSFNAYDNPVYYKYFDDYMNILGEEFGKIKFYRINILVEFYYKIHKDGTISDLKVGQYTNSPMNAKKLKQLVENNLPPKFYDGMDEEWVNVNLDFSTNRYYDEFTIDHYSPRVVKDGKFRIFMDRRI